MTRAQTCALEKAEDDTELESFSKSDETEAEAHWIDFFETFASVAKFQLKLLQLC
jgi:hypothetical protein